MQKILTVFKRHHDFRVYDEYDPQCEWIGEPGVRATEKLDGTNSQIMLTYEYRDGLVGDIEDYVLASFPTEEGRLFMLAGSRKRWIAPESTIMHMEEPVKGTDNFGFARWVQDNADELSKLGEGRHYGEWYGKGIQRGYGLDEKRFALFNVARWGSHNPNTPACCQVVPILECKDPDEAMQLLATSGSVAAPGFAYPEGIVVYHTASRTLYKETFEMDNGKWNA